VIGRFPHRAGAPLVLFLKIKISFHTSPVRSPLMRILRVARYRIHAVQGRALSVRHGWREPSPTRMSKATGVTR